MQETAADWEDFFENFTTAGIDDDGWLSGTIFYVLKGRGLREDTKNTDRQIEHAVDRYR